MLKLVCLALLVFAPAAAQNAGAVYHSADRPTALALIGDRYHSPVYIRDGIAKALVRENIPVTFITEVTELNAETLARNDLLIILRDGMNWPHGYERGKQVIWMTDPQQQAIWDFVNRGGGFLALHNAQGLYPPDGPYYKIFGGDYGGHPKPYRFTIRVEDHNHPVMAGVEDFQVFDEHHTVKYYLDREHLLFRTMAEDNLAAAGGWWNEVGTGRFVYLSPGHTVDALEHPMMQRMIRNAANWLLRK